MKGVQLKDHFFVENIFYKNEAFFSSVLLNENCLFGFLDGKRE